MKRSLVAWLVLVAVFLPVPAAAGESYRCWTEVGLDPDRGIPTQVVVCRIIGGEVIVFDGPGDVPVVLHPAVGIAGGIECFYWRSAFTGWVIERYVGSNVVLRYEPPGGGALYDAVYPRCATEPGDGPPPLALVWQVISRLEVPDPVVTFDPPATVAGLATYAMTERPASRTGSITSPVTGRRVTVELSVDRVTVAWGDGAELAIGDGLLAALGGHPDGALRHVYERSGRYPVAVAFAWRARWRVDLGVWRFLRLAPTETVANLVVGELVGRRTG